MVLISSPQLVSIICFLVTWVSVCYALSLNMRAANKGTAAQEYKKEKINIFGKSSIYNQDLVIEIFTVQKLVHKQ